MYYFIIIIIFCVCLHLVFNYYIRVIANSYNKITRILPFVSNVDISNLPRRILIIT